MCTSRIQRKLFYVQSFGTSQILNILHSNFLSFFDENLTIVDSGIKNVTNLFNEIFNDEKIAFIFTSDHGMSNKGAHGAGTAHETETPIVTWGAGINDWKELNEAPTDVISISNVDVPRFDIQQADVASLISALIGNAVPVNNVGRLPHIYLNASMVIHMLNEFSLE